MIVALIPARGNSKGIPKKNLRLFNGKPLISWTIEEAKKSSLINRVIVSTEDKDIAETSIQFGAEVPFMRPNDLSKDETPSIDVVLHAINSIKDSEWILLLQPTSPLRSSNDIDKIVSFCMKNKGLAAVSICKVNKNPFWMYNLDNESRIQPIVQSCQEITRRQMVNQTFILNGALYLAHKNFLLKNRSFITDQTLGYIMSNDKSIDIDTMDDWESAEKLHGAIHE